MKKRLEQFTPDPESSRPTALSEETKKSADAFAEHLAAVLRDEKHAHEESAPPLPKPPEFPPIPRSPELQPVRIETKPSAQEALTPFSETSSDSENPEELKVRPGFSDEPFAPPEEDPSLDEIFQCSADNSAPASDAEAKPETASSDSRRDDAVSQETDADAPDTPPASPAEHAPTESTAAEVAAGDVLSRFPRWRSSSAPPRRRPRRRKRSRFPRHLPLRLPRDARPALESFGAC